MKSKDFLHKFYFGQNKTPGLQALLNSEFDQDGSRTIMELKDKSGKVHKNSRRALIKPLDVLRAGDKTLFDKYGAQTSRANIMTTRGCPYECTFCSNPIMFGRRYFVREIYDLIKQIKYYIEKYKITGLQFYDLTALVKNKWVLEFCDALK